MIHKILRVFVNTLIVDDNHYLLNRDKLTLPTQMHLYAKQKTFYEIFLAFLKCIFNFKDDHGDKLTQPIQMQLSKKEKSFSEISFAVLNSLLNFKHSPTKDDPHRSAISENTVSEKDR